MRVHVCSPLRSYTGGAAEVDGSGATLGDVLAGLEARHPGLRFRIVDEQDRPRPHILFFIGTAKAESLSEPVPAGAEIHIIAALSGG